MQTDTDRTLIAELMPQESERLPWMLDVAIREGWRDEVEAEAELWRPRVVLDEGVTVAGLRHHTNGKYGETGRKLSPLRVTDTGPGKGEAAIASARGTELKRRQFAESRYAWS